jgi:alkyl sulfatase BDS1-like metallo-beta-lactamase superfamily hydrolase
MPSNTSRSTVTAAAPAVVIPIIAPAGFLEHAVSENVYAGTSERS